MANNLPKIGNIDFDWNDLKYALVVARHGGLSHAAKLLGTSASTVSRHIQQLETSLGQTLFLRQQSGYLLTDEGKEVLDLIGGVEQALLALDRHPKPEADTQQVSGLVRVACSEMVASHMIIPQLPALYAEHPDLQVELVIDLRLADLNRREADLALRMISPGNKVADQDYIAQQIARTEYATYVSSKINRKKDVERYISWGQDWAHLPIVEWLGQQLKSKSVALSVNSANAQLQAAKLGVGIVMLPRYVGDNEPGLREIELSKQLIFREFWLLVHRDLKGSNRVQVMREFLKSAVLKAMAESGGNKRSG